jgi:CHAD domain-containing protein
MPVPGDQHDQKTCLQIYNPAGFSIEFAMVRNTPQRVDALHLADYAHRRGAMHRQAARAALRSDAYSQMLIEFTAAVQALPDDGTPRLDTFAPRCLDKRARQVSQLAAQALGSDASARHRLRVAYKRLRYGIEFFAALFPGELLRRYHLSASGLQEMLGQLNDLAVAVELSSEALPGEQGEVVCCWLEGQTERLLPELGDLLSDFREQAVPWRMPAG